METRLRKFGGDCPVDTGRRGGVRRARGQSEVWNDPTPRSTRPLRGPDQGDGTRVQARLASEPRRERYSSSPGSTGRPEQGGWPSKPSTTGLDSPAPLHFPRRPGEVARFGLYPSDTGALPGSRTTYGSSSRNRHGPYPSPAESVTRGCHHCGNSATDRHEGLIPPYFGQSGSIPDPASPHARVARQERQRPYKPPYAGAIPVSRTIYGP